MDTGQKTESVAQLVDDISRDAVALPEFQRDFVWDIEKTFDLFDSFARDIFVGSLIYGIPSFEITVRELDRRPRSGKGSRARLKLNSYTRSDIEKLVKINGFRLLLDGQQRATSIFRAMTGVDPVYFVTLRDDEMTESVRNTPISKRTIECVLSEFRGEPLQGRVSISLHDVFRTMKGEFPREKDKVSLFLDTNILEGITPENAEDSSEFVTFLTQLKNLEHLFRQEKLVAYYLLDTDEEKFALFFERSNSKGIQLNFIDILAAKLYSGFNLRDAVQNFADDNPNLELNREVLVRAISFRVSGGKEMGRSYILSTLNQAHFNEHWERFVSAYKLTYDFLVSTRLLIHPGWMPYENMVIPLVSFITQLPQMDYSQINSDQANLLRTWYWLAIFSRRYSSAAQTYALEDAQALERAAKGDFGSILQLIARVQPLIKTAEDLLVIHKKYDAIYKGVLNLINFSTHGFLNLENNNPVSIASNLEDHHIFPNDYLKKNWARVHESLDSEIAIDCVANRTLIPKLTNVKVGNKPPSKYLKEIKNKNQNIEDALASHMINAELLSGDYDEMYDYFLHDRADSILSAMELHILRPRREILEKFHVTDPHVPRTR